MMRSNDQGVRESNVPEWSLLLIAVAGSAYAPGRHWISAVIATGLFGLGYALLRRARARRTDRDK